MINVYYLKYDHFKKDKLRKLDLKFQGFFEWFKDVAMNRFVGLHCLRRSHLIKSTFM